MCRSISTSQIASCWWVFLSFSFFSMLSIINSSFLPTVSVIICLEKVSRCPQLPSYCGGDFGACLLRFQWLACSYKSLLPVGFARMVGGSSWGAWPGSSSIICGGGFLWSTSPLGRWCRCPNTCHLLAVSCIPFLLQASRKPLLIHTMGFSLPMVDTFPSQNSLFFNSTV